MFHDPAVRIGEAFLITVIRHTKLAFVRATALVRAIRMARPAAVRCAPGPGPLTLALPALAAWIASRRFSARNSSAGMSSSGLLRSWSSVALARSSSAYPQCNSSLLASCAYSSSPCGRHVWRLRIQVPLERSSLDRRSSLLPGSLPGSTFGLMFGHGFNPGQRPI